MVQVYASFITYTEDFWKAFWKAGKHTFREILKGCLVWGACICNSYFIFHEVSHRSDISIAIKENIGKQCLGHIHTSQTNFSTVYQNNSLLENAHTSQTNRSIAYQKNRLLERIHAYNRQISIQSVTRIHYWNTHTHITDSIAHAHNRQIALQSHQMNPLLEHTYHT